MQPEKIMPNRENRENIITYHLLGSLQHLTGL